MCFPWRGTSVCCQGVRPGSRVRGRAERHVHSLEPQGTQGEAVASFAAPLCSLLRSQVRKQRVKRGTGARLLTLALLLASSGPLQVALLLLFSSVRCKSNITGVAKGLWGLTRCHHLCKTSHGGVGCCKCFCCCKCSGDRPAELVACLLSWGQFRTARACWVLGPAVPSSLLPGLSCKKAASLNAAYLRSLRFPQQVQSPSFRGLQQGSA